MALSPIIEGKNNIKMEILEEIKFMIEHDFQNMSLGSRYELLRKKTSGFPTRSDTNLAVQPQKMARSL